MGNCSVLPSFDQSQTNSVPFNGFFVSFFFVVEATKYELLKFGPLNDVRLSDAHPL